MGKYVEEYQNPELSEKLTEKIKKSSRKNIRLMEVCGTHTMAIFRSGIRSLLPKTINLLSGPGCPVCVTDQSEIDAFIEMCGLKDVVITTFGDLMRVPGSGSNLEKERSKGADIRVVYSAFDGVKIAQKEPDKKVVFLGVGFETTAPTIAASILWAKENKIENFMVYSAHKQVLPALMALMKMRSVNVDGFILPGHVSVIIGEKGYLPLMEKYPVPCVIAGFEPADILRAVNMLVHQIESEKPCLENAYTRAVSFSGNKKAQKIMWDIFEPEDAGWRGLGMIHQSGMGIREDFSGFDAKKRLTIELKNAKEPKGCACGQVITGIKTPPQCPMFKKTCTPENPVGPCMVSTEGTCAAYYRFYTGGLDNKE